MRTTMILTGIVFLWGASHLFATPPNPLEAVAPPYPLLALYSGTSGTVTIRATVSKAGKVKSAKLAEGHQGHPLLRSPARDAAKQWRFEPGNEKHEVNLVFVFRIMPKNAPFGEGTTRFHYPWRIEVRRVAPEVQPPYVQLPIEIIPPE